MIEGLCQEDEAYYIFSGYSSYLKSIDKVDSETKAEYKFESGFTMQAYPLVYASLSLLGNNYYGARVPIVLFFASYHFFYCSTPQKKFLKRNI